MTKVTGFVESYLSKIGFWAFMFRSLNIVYEATSSDRINKKREQIAVLSEMPLYFL